MVIHMALRRNAQGHPLGRFCAPQGDPGLVHTYQNTGNPVEVTCMNCLSMRFKVCVWREEIQRWMPQRSCNTREAAEAYVAQMSRYLKQPIEILDTWENIMLHEENEHGT